MNNIKIMMVVYVVATILCGMAGITNILKGNTSNGILWFIASVCWLTCIFNVYKNSNFKK